MRPVGTLSGRKGLEKVFPADTAAKLFTVDSGELSKTLFAAG
jgi:hypothetical protein